MNRSKITRFTRSAITLGVLAAIPTLAAAQSMAAADVTEEVMVTARRFSERLQDVPVAITALSGAELEEHGVRSILDLEKIVPSLRATTFNNPDTLVVGIRGQRNSQVQPGQDPSIGIYLGEVPTGFQIGLNVGLFDLHDIQVLKGPQGTLFGRNSTGGALLINPQKPTSDFEGYVKGQGTFFDEGNGANFQAVLNVPITDKFAMRISVDTVNRDGYIKNAAGPYQIPEIYPTPKGLSNLENLGDQESQTGRIGLKWNPTPDIENYTMFQTIRYRSENGVNPTLTAVNPAFPIRATVPTVVAFLPTFLAATRAAQSDYFWTTMSGSQGFVEVDSEQAINTTTWNVAGVTLKNILGYKHLDSRRFQDSVGIPYELVQSFYNRQRGIDISEEFQVQGNSFDDRLKWVAGLFYFDNTYDSGTNPSIQLVVPGSLAPPLPSERTAYTKNKTKAAFVQGTYAFPQVPGLSGTLGFRYTQDEREMRVVNTTNNGTVCGLFNATGQRLPIAQCEYNGSKDFSSPTYTAVLDYKVDPQTLVYFSNSRGYRSGAFNIASTTPTAFIPVDPETVDNFEVGLKKDWDVAGVPVRTNVAIYYQDYQDIQRIAQDTRAGVVSAARLFNATKAVVKGAELEVSAQPAKGLHLGATYSYIDPEYKQSFFVAAPGGGQQDVALNTFSLVPHNTYTLNASYLLPLDNTNGTFTISGDYYHQSRMYFDDVAQGPLYGPLESQSMKPYGITNARVDWKGVMGSKNLDAAFWVSNLTNTKYYSSATPIYTSIGAWSNIVGTPRMFWLELKYSFAK